MPTDWSTFYGGEPNTQGYGSSVGLGQQQAIDIAKQGQGNIQIGQPQPTVDVINQKNDQHGQGAVMAGTLNQAVGLGQQKAIDARQGQNTAPMPVTPGLGQQAAIDIAKQQQKAANQANAPQVQTPKMPDPIKAEQAAIEQQKLINQQALENKLQEVSKQANMGLGITNEAPDYIKIAQTANDILSTQHARDWQNQLDFMSQRAAERGMKSTDISNWLAHMEMGDRMGLLDARQNILLDGIKNQARFDEQQFLTKQGWERQDLLAEESRIWDMVNNNWGDEEAVNAALMMGVALRGEDSVFADMLRDPTMLRNLNDAGYNALTQQRNIAASEILRNLNDSTDVNELNGAFDDYYRSKYGTEGDVYVPTGWNPSQIDETILADFAQMNGGFRPTDAEDLKRLYAYDKYRTDVDKSFKNEVATELVNNYLTNGGSEDVAARIRETGTDFVFSLIEDGATTNTLGGKYDATDPINGVMAHLYSDWDGKVYDSQKAWEDRDQLDKNLDKAWSAYLTQVQSQGGSPMDRWEFAKAIDETLATNFPDGSGNIASIVVDDNAGKWLASNVIANSGLSQGQTTLEGAVATGKQGVSNLADIEKLSPAQPEFFSTAMSLSDNDFYTMVTEPAYSELLKQSGYVPTPVSEIKISGSTPISKVNDMGIKPGAILMNDKTGGREIVHAIVTNTDRAGRSSVKVYTKAMNKDGTLGPSLPVIDVADDRFNYTVNNKEITQNANDGLDYPLVSSDLYANGRWK